MAPIYTDSQILVLKVLCGIIPTIVALATCLRVWIKGRDKWWVDDLLATLGVLVMMEQQAVLWSLAIYQPPTLAVFYVSVLPNPTAVWYDHPSRSCPSRIAMYTFFRLARSSILASVIHIMPVGPLRVGALYLSGLFTVLYVVIIAQFVWVCGKHMERGPTGIPQCAYKPQVGILQITAAMISDALLIFLPLRTLRDLRNQPHLRRRLQVIFAASALTTCASIVSGVFNCLSIEFGYVVVVEIEMWISLIVCNFAVLASALFKITGKYSSTKPTGTIYSSRGRRVGVASPQRSPVSPCLVRTGRDDASEDERSRVDEFSEVDGTIDLELADVSTMTRTKSLSSPPTPMFNGQHIYPGV